MKSGWEKLFRWTDKEGDKATLVDGRYYDNGYIDDAHISLTAYTRSDEDGITYIIMVKDVGYDNAPILILPDVDVAYEEYKNLAKKLADALITDDWPVLVGHTLSAVLFQNASESYEDQDMLERFYECDAYPRPFFRQLEGVYLYHAN